MRSHSVSAQGGINAALAHADPQDAWEAHFRDTIEGSDHLADPPAVEVLCQSAPEAIYELEHMGAVFSRTGDGRIDQRPFGGAGSPRTCYSADRTGHDLLHTLYEQAVGRPIRFYDECFVTALAIDNGRCLGCLAWDLVEGRMFALSAGTTVLACGGYGRTYARTTNSYINTGDGAALLPAEEERVEALFSSGGSGDIAALRAELQGTMSDRFGIFRSGEAMLGGLEKIKAIRQKASKAMVRGGSRTYRQDLVALLELRSMVLVAEAVARSALRREESRGSHYRTDHPERDDRRFFHQSLARLCGGAYVLGAAPVGARDMTTLQERMT